jgi:toxin-antitoxin system PIN domain toxin
LTALDTNVLVHAHRRDSRWHARAAGCVRRLAEGRAAWAIPWPCLHEFLAIVTHPRIYDPPSTLEEALDQIDAWMASPGLVILGEPHDHWSILRGQLAAAQVRGPMVHDARIAAICIGHGVHELLTADRDFSRFSSLAVRNPLVG